MFLFRTFDMPISILVIAMLTGYAMYLLLINTAPF